MGKEAFALYPPSICLPTPQVWDGRQGGGDGDPVRALLSRWPFNIRFFPDPLLTFSVWQCLAWGCASSWWFFSYPGFKGEASERCSHTALGPTFKGSCSLGCVLQNQATGCRPPAKNTVEQLAYEYLQVNQLSYRCLLYETRLCLRTQNFASTVISVTFPRIQTRPVPWMAGVGKPEYPWLQVQAMLYWEDWGLLPKDLASGYPHTSLEVFPTPSRVFTKALLLSATWILHHHPAPANSLERGWWTESSWTKVEVYYLANVLSTLPYFSVGGWTIWESGTVVDGLQVALVLTGWGTQIVIDHLLSSSVFSYLYLNWWWSYWPHKMM